MNTFDDWAGEQNFRQWDLAISRWGDATSKNNAQYEIAPFYVPGNVAPFVVPPGTLAHMIKWESGRAEFKTVRGSSLHTGETVVAERIFSSGVPSPGQGKLHLQFYVVASDRSPLQKDNEVVIDKFEYLP